MKGAMGAIALGTILLLWAGCSGDSHVSGEGLYLQAKNSDSSGAYRKALSLYTQAQPVLRREGNTALVKECRLAIKRLGLILSDYTATEQDVRNTLNQTFPGISESTIGRLLARIDAREIEGVRYYYQDFSNTVIHLDLSLMQRLPKEMERNRLGYSALKPFTLQPGPAAGTPYRNPITYTATAQYDVPRNLLPPAGTLKIWQPVPIRTDCQTDVEILSVTPQHFVKNPASLDGDLGDIYLEVPLADLLSPLRVDVAFRFRHFEQRFTMIDPDHVGAYDTSSTLYRTYTASAKNIVITPEIAAKAREVAAGEQNPYRAARKIYDYVVNSLTYSHTPHGTLGVLNIPESAWVHEHRYGDCGAQSMYFAALCRSLGIPARATGGYQLFPGMEGSHFWAEFFLPNYGWVPVDTSVAQIADYLPELTSAEKAAFRDYFFGSMDPYRWVIQRDVDLPFVPAAPEPTVFSMVLQTPASLCDTMDDIPEDVIWPGYQIRFTPGP